MIAAIEIESMQDLDRNADVLEAMGVYEDSLEHALLNNEPVTISMLERSRLRQEGLTVR